MSHKIVIWSSPGVLNTTLITWAHYDANGKPATSLTKRVE